MTWNTKEYNAKELEYKFLLHDVVVELEIKMKELNISEKELAEKIDIESRKLKLFFDGDRDMSLRMLYNICHELETDIQTIISKIN